jgi:hypothetical protein
LDLKIALLILFAITAILFALRYGVSFSLGELWKTFLDILLVPIALLTAAVFAIILFRLNPEELILNLTSAISSRNVSFITAVPPNLQQTLAAKIVQRQDTDGDGFEEWVVFYEYDLKSGGNPVQVTIYDSDRGIPPVIFPYNLITPNGNYLGETAGSINFSLINVTQDANGTDPDNLDLPELVVTGWPGRLSIFRYNPENKAVIPPAEPPSDSPVRYESIGFFQGSGGSNLNAETQLKNVTVQDKDLYARSQLAVRSIYQLNPETNYSSYYRQNCDPEQIDQCELAEPVIETVDFYGGLPNDIFQSRHPEKIVLGFYAATCGQPDGTLCARANQIEWNYQDFLDPNGDAIGGEPSYFGLNSFDNTRNLEVASLEFAASQTLDQSINVNDAAVQDVQITFTVDDDPTPKALRFEMRRNDAGEWKIFRRVESDTALSNANSLD